MLCDARGIVAAREARSHMPKPGSRGECEAGVMWEERDELPWDLVVAWKKNELRLHLSFRLGM